MTNRKKRTLKIGLMVFTLVACLVYFVVENVLPYSGIKPYRVNAATLAEFKNGTLPSDYGLDYEPFDVMTPDSLTLRGYFIKADNPFATIILLHGIADCKEHFYPFCQQLKEIGCQTIIFDARAHGKSDGQYCTFGYFEKKDIATFIDSLKHKNIKQPIGIYGNSLGGAVALQALGENSDLKFGIIESTFDEFSKVALEYGEDFTGLRSETLTNHVLTKSGKIAHFNPFEVKPVASCAKINCPIFMAHGIDDNKIPISFGERNFNNLKTTDKQFIRVQDAGHFDLHEKGGTAYWEKMKQFILKNKI